MEHQIKNPTKCYPLAAYLCFVPGGLDYGDFDKLKQNNHWHILNDVNPNNLIREAYTADRVLRKYAILSSGLNNVEVCSESIRNKVFYEENDNVCLNVHNENDKTIDSILDTNIPLFLPSLSMLAEAVFAPLTGVKASIVRRWADLMVLAYLDEGDRKWTVLDEGNDNVTLLEQWQNLHNTSLFDSVYNSGKPPTSTSISCESDLITVLKSLHDSYQPSVYVTNSCLPRYRRPCGYVFRRGDIAWNCRTCQFDSTCVLCEDCFRNSDHDGHDVFFHRTTPGGCCDCGDIEAWAIEGCCQTHRPNFDRSKMSNSERKNDMRSCFHTNSKKCVNPNIVDWDKISDPDEDLEAVRTSLHDRDESSNYIRRMLPKSFASALGIVIGAAVDATVRAVDGAGIGSDLVQWSKRWADQMRHILNGRSVEEEYNVDHPLYYDFCDKDSNSPKLSSVVSIGEAIYHTFPPNFYLHLRLHNDDVHTFEEVTEALFPNKGSHSSQNGYDEEPPETKPENGLVANKEKAKELTHLVDSEGEVLVRSYLTFAGARAGFQRLKSRGLHCAVLSKPQVDLELRARMLLLWLADVAASHPAAAALVVHALVDVTKGRASLGDVHMWTKGRMIPPWCFPHEPSMVKNNEVLLPGWRRRMFVFPPHLLSSYLTRKEALQLHHIGVNGLNYKNNGFGQFPSSRLYTSEEFKKVSGMDSKINFYSNRLRQLPRESYRKSPHALWGVLPVSDTPTNKPIHPLLYKYKSIFCDQVNIFDDLIVLDTDMRKQQETDTLTNIIYPHKLLGLHMVSGVSILETRENYVNVCNDAIPCPISRDSRYILPISSFRAPVSPLLLLLLLDPYPPKKIRCAIHSLFLSLMVNSRFKSIFAANLGGVAYRPLSTLFCAGVGTEADTLLGFTVQIFTTGSIVRALTNLEATKKLLIQDREVMTASEDAYDVVFTLPIAHMIVHCIHTNLLGASEEVRMLMKTTAPDNSYSDTEVKIINASTIIALTYHGRERHLTKLLPTAPDDGFLEHRLTKHKRLSHILRDLEYILETPGTALRLLHSFPNIQINNELTVQPGCFIGHDPITITNFHVVWCRLLRLVQGMDLHKRKISGGHVEYESLRWLEAFSLSLNFDGVMDALAECQSNFIPNIGQPCLEIIRKAIGNLCLCLLYEIKRWLYKEDILETDFPVPAINGQSNDVGDISKMEALQRSTLHVSSSSIGVAVVFHHTDSRSLALSCATKIKMSEAQLVIIEDALKLEQSQHQFNVGRCTIMGDSLRVPHSPLAGDCFSYHIPLHRSLARCIRSFLSIVISHEIREAKPYDWWLLPILDFQTVEGDKSNGHIFVHPVTELIKPALKASDCCVIWAGKPDCTSEQAKHREFRCLFVSATVASAKIIHSLCDHPLRCLIAAEQTTRHLWVRNGVAASGMAVNYSSVPLCRSFRDLDLFMIQFSASGLSIGLGPTRVFFLLISRFNMDGYLCDPERKNCEFITRPGVNWVNPPRLQDSDHAAVLAEAIFTTICILVTELPPPPPLTTLDDIALRRNIRKELLHALAVEPRSHSEAMTAAGGAMSRRHENDGNNFCSGGGAKLFKKVFSDELQNISRRKNQGPHFTGAPLFELKAEFSDEYDPSYFHLTRSDHQHAMDNIAYLRKQNISMISGSSVENKKKCLPLVCAPPPAHPRFMPCRLILHLPSLDAAIRRSLLYALTDGQWLPPPDPALDKGEINDRFTTDDHFSLQPSEIIANKRKIQNATNSTHPGLYKTASELINFSSALGKSLDNSRQLPSFSPEVVASSCVNFIEVLQVVTLQVHTLEECASLYRSHPGLDYDCKSLSSCLSINSYLRRLIHVPESLLDVWALRCYPHGPLSSKGSGDNRGSILGLLIALYEHRAENDNSQSNRTERGEGENGFEGARYLVADGLKWFLRFVNNLVDGVESFRKSFNSATDGIPIRCLTLNHEYCSFSWTIDPFIKSTVIGMLRCLPNLWPKVYSMSETPTIRDTKDGITGKNKEERKAAQRRILEYMRKKQASFAANLGETELKSNSNGQQGYVNDEIDLCIICRCDNVDSENNGPLGYLGYVQRSRTLQLRCEAEAASNHKSFHMYFYLRVVGEKGCQIRESKKIDSAKLVCLPIGSLVKVIKDKVSPEYDILSRRILLYYEDFERGIELTGWASVKSSEGYIILSPITTLCYKNSRWGCTRPVVRQCGHAAHLNCVKTHFSSLHTKAETDNPYDGRFAANIKDGEFLCPLCKQLSNVVVPEDKYEFDKYNLESKHVPVLPASLSNFQALLRNTLEHRSKRDIVDENRRAIKHYGERLYESMQTSSWNENNILKEKQVNVWKPSLKEWDPKEFTGDAETNFGDILCYIRQQHIAWAAIGHSAAASEASKRGIRQEEFDLPISDPWIDYCNSPYDVHPSLLELRRTLTAASALYNVVCDELEEKLGAAKKSSSKAFSVIGGLLANILEGFFWTSLSSDYVEHDKNIKTWRVISSILSSTPCHVSRDDTFSMHQDVRAATVAMWVMKGLGSNNIPIPLAVRNVVSSIDILEKNWGTLNPLDLSIIKNMTPFRPAVASTFLYIPLLSWELHTLSGAIFSILLSHRASDVSRQQCMLSIIFSARLLLIGRIIQVLITEFRQDNIKDWESRSISNEDITKEAMALLALRNHCFRILNKTPLSETTDESNDKIFLAEVSLAILPYARTLLLLLRAATSGLRQKFGSDLQDNYPCFDVGLVDLLAKEDEGMLIEDGFYFVLKLGCPMPSEIMRNTLNYNDKENSSSWLHLIDRWLHAVKTLDSYHGSRGSYLSLDKKIRCWKKCSSDFDRKIIFSTHLDIKEKFSNSKSFGFCSNDIISMDDTQGTISTCALTNGTSYEKEDKNNLWNGDINNKSSTGFYLHNNVVNRHSVLSNKNASTPNNEVNCLVTEHIVDLSKSRLGLIEHVHDGQYLINDLGNYKTAHGNIRKTCGSNDFDRFSTDDREFACVSRSAVIPYQSSFLGDQPPGPGPRGKPFNYEKASKIMADMSHFGMKHFVGSKKLGLICLPKSFVDLYRIINKAEINDKGSILDGGDFDSNMDTALCLITGNILQTGLLHRFSERGFRSPGACTLHARKVGSGTGIFFLVQKCTVLLIHNNKSAYSASLYVDENGEEDTSLKRGRPLCLKEERLIALENLWRQHGIPRKVAQIRSTADRVIRDNWY